MNILNIIKNNLFIQNFFSNLVLLLHPYLDLTISKYLAIRKALYITAHDKTLGSYLEFGVFTGSSFNFAIKSSRKLDKIFGNSNCDFYGFDSFDGFGDVKNFDKSPAFKDKTFSVNKEKVLKNIRNVSKNTKTSIIEGFFQDTIKNKTPKNFNIKFARVIMIDCDLKEPTKIALEFVKPVLQIGTIILFDDYLYFKGNKEHGEYSAFEEFKNNNKEIEFREAYEYGYGGKAFIVCKI